MYRIRAIKAAKGAALLAVVLSVLPGCGSDAVANEPAPSSITVTLRDGSGAVKGQAVLTEADGGVRMRVTVNGLAPGRHGIHFHEKGVCQGPDFASAGEHLNPAGKHHGLENPEGPHAGDLPNLTVDAKGSSDIVLFSPLVTLQAGKPNSLRKPGGTALIVHEKADDQKTDPSGNSGARMLCGVIE
ncbi:superoxide dismutase family protein [Paenibacillus thermoaerophilus]|uniref:Superoxide dismutase family protein n=1 Tax=Paenibacillus thermoaerophilus TaxID=1215385 RepID=A0ABW2V4H8_9BACL|nr:superoxide dismutase family protein [Paenibacillus thermoaerophilus]TMV15925.1 superoxide dismutase family protein [Paenibacillus thermoaerophilus]